MKLQLAFNESQSFEFALIEAVRALPRETEKEFRERLKAAEQRALDLHGGDARICNVSLSASSSDLWTNVSFATRLRWQDEGYRARMLTALKSHEATPESRAKMSEAKLGRKNPNSRPVTLTFQGDEISFDSVSEAALYFGVKQQVMDGWLAERFPWPGCGRRVSANARHLVGLRGVYAQTK